MALLKVTGTTYTLLHLFLMFYTQAQAQNLTATPAASTATAPASTFAAPSSTTTPPSSTQLVSSSAASGGTTATLSSSSGASLNTASQASTVPTSAATTSPTLSTIITTSTTTISSSNTSSSLTVSTTLPNTTSPSSTLPTQTNTTVSPNVTTTSEHNTTALPNVTMTSEHNTTVSPNVTMTTEHNTTVSPNVTMTSEHNTTVLPNVTMTSEQNTTVSPNVTMTTEQNTTVSPNVTMTSQPNTTDSLNDTVTNSTNVSGTSTSSAATGSASSTTSLSPPATSTISPSPTTTATPTRPPQGSTVVVMLTAVTAGYHPAKVNFTLDNINRWSSGLCDTNTTTSVVALRITSGSGYFYYVNNITETIGTANSVTFTCMVDDLPNLSTRFYGTITCSRDSQSCTSGNGAGTCASFTMVTNQCSVSFLWPSHQNVSIVYNPNVLSFTCREDKTISCSANIDVSQVTGATSATPTSSSPETPIADNFTSRDGDKGHSGVILGVILSILVVAIALGLGVVWWRQSNSKQRGSVQFHNDGSQPRASNPVGLRIGEKRTLHRLQSSNSDDTEFEFSSVNLSPTAPSPQATIDVTSGQKLHSKNDSADHNTASGAHHKYATNDQESGDNSQRVSHVYDLPTDDRKAH